MRERLSVLRHRDFRNLWLGQSASAIGAAVVIVAIALYVTQLMSFAAGLTVALVLPLSVATGMGFALFEVFWDTTMAERIPPHALSRASAWEWMGSLALLPFGYLLAGPAAEATSPETVMVTGAILTAMALAAGLLPRDTRTLRRAEHSPHV